MAPVCKPKVYGLQNGRNEKVLDATYAFLVAQESGTEWIALKDGKDGVINQKGEWIIKPDFETIMQYENGFAVAGKKVKREDAGLVDDYSGYYYGDSAIAFGIIDQSGAWVVEAKYAYLRMGDDGTLLYMDAGHFGYLNADGSTLIRAQYDIAVPMSNGTGIIAEKQKSGYNAGYGSYYNPNLSGNEREGRYYLIDHAGNKLNQEPYEYIRGYKEKRAAFNKGGFWKKKSAYDYNPARLRGGKWGFLDPSGKEIIPAIYDYVYDFSNGKAKVQLGARTFWIDAEGKECAPPDPGAEDTKISVYCEPGFYGYIDLKGNWVIEPQYLDAGNFSEGLASAVTLKASDMDCMQKGEGDDDADDSNGDDDQSSFDILRKGITGNGYDVYSKGLTYSVKHRRLYGYIDPQGVMVIPARYERAEEFSCGRAYVCFRNKWGVIDRSGNWIMAPVLDWLSYMDYDYSMPNEGDEGSYSPLGYSAGATENLYRFSENFGVIYKYGKYGFIDTTGNIVVAPVYDKVQPFHNGLAAVRYNGLWGYIDKTGKEVIPRQFISAKSFGAEGLAPAALSPRKANAVSDDQQAYENDGINYFGYIDTKGNWVIKPQYTYAGVFSDGLADVAVDFGKRGYINASGNFVITPRFDYTGSFRDGYAVVKMRMFKAVYVDKTGKVSKEYSLEKPPRDKSVPLNADYNSSGRGGYVNEKGEEVIAHQFASCGKFAKVTR
ncbi:MAG TPA: WG repeat-containing protein [Bacteroidia bacterium]|nr:WG repeat-containing protein [Bacteroidia bacterium]